MRRWQSALGLSATSQDPTTPQAPQQPTAPGPSLPSQGTSSGQLQTVAGPHALNTAAFAGCRARADTSLPLRHSALLRKPGGCQTGAGSGPAGSCTGRANARLFAQIYADVPLVQGKGPQLNTGRETAVCVQGIYTDESQRSQHDGSQTAAICL